MLRISALVLAAVCMLAGCKKEDAPRPPDRTTAPVTRGAYESFNRDYVSRNKELTAILKSAQDELSAEAAADKIQDLEPVFQNLADRMEKLSQPTREQEAEFDKEFGMSEVAGALRKEVARVKGDLRLKPAYEAYLVVESLMSPKGDD